MGYRTYDFGRVFDDLALKQNSEHFQQINQFSSNGQSVCHNPTIKFVAGPAHHVPKTLDKGGKVTVISKLFLGRLLELRVNQPSIF